MRDVFPSYMTFERIWKTGDLQKIAKTDAFSAIASGGAVEGDFVEVKSNLLEAGIANESCVTNIGIHRLVKYIAARMIIEHPIPHL